MASSQFKATSISSPKPNKPNKTLIQSPPQNKNLLSPRQGVPKKSFKEKLALNKLNNHTTFQEVGDSSTDEVSNLFTPQSGKSITHRESFEPSIVYVFNAL